MIGKRFACLFASRRKAGGETADNGAVQREGVKILGNESHQSEDNKKLWI